jgi:uncharacterized membrane protein
MAEETTNNSGSNATLIRALSYATILWLVPYFTVKGADRDEGMVTHLRQGFGAMLVSVILYIIWNIPLVSTIVLIVWIAMSVIGILNVVSGNNKELPIVGPFFNTTFSFVK